MNCGQWTIVPEFVCRMFIFVIGFSAFKDHRKITLNVINLSLCEPDEQIRSEGLEDARITSYKCQS